LLPPDSLSTILSVSFLLKGLGSEYDPFVTSVTTRVDPLSIDELYGHLLAHEMRLEQQIPSIDVHPPAANITTRTSSSVVVAVVLTTEDLDLSTTKDAVPISPLMQLLLDLPAKFVASPNTQQSVATTNRTNLSRLNSLSRTSGPIPKVITPHPYRQLKNCGILTLVQLTISPAIFRIST
jgi:hypothetical protein